MRDDAGSLDSSGFSVHDIVAPIARHKFTVAACFLVVAAATGIVAWLTPADYVSEMTFLVQRERVDPIMSADANAQTPDSSVDEVEMMSQVELLGSRDLLEQVVLDAGLHDPKRFENSTEEAQARAASVRRLRARLTIVPIRRTRMIRVQYRGRDPQMAAQVLDRLSQRYLDKHLAVHRPLDSHEFFGEQVQRAQQELSEAEGRLTDFARREAVVVPEQERTAVLQQLGTFQAMLQQARAEMADADRRLGAIQAQLGQTPDRQVTAVRTANGGLLAQLNQRVLEMELQREELLRKFTPQYPAVVQLEAQLTHTRDVLALAEMAPIMDETTDQNPTHQWLRNEEARIRAERAALEARVASIQRSVNEYEGRARRLNEQTVAQQELLRNVKTAEEASLLYQRKEEEARISDALDRMRIANVRVADAPSVPQSPSNSARSLVIILGLFAALLFGLGSAYARDWMNPVVHSSRDVQSVLNVPVLAAVPSVADGRPGIRVR